jgi:hypothetical protein
MKKGCFLSLIITITIILGVTFYMVQKYSDEAVSYISGFAADRIAEDIEKHAKGIEADSLKSFVKKLPVEIQNDKINLDQVSEIGDVIEHMYKDGVVDSLELIRLADTLKFYEAEHERSKKDKH